MSFTNLVVRKWDGEEWPEKRMSLGCKDDKQAVAISPRYVDLDVAEQDFQKIALRVNNHERLKWVLSRIIEDLPRNKDWLDPAVEGEARALLAELDAGEGGDE